MSGWRHCRQPDVAFVVPPETSAVGQLLVDAIEEGWSRGRRTGVSEAQLLDGQLSAALAAEQPRGGVMDAGCVERGVP